MLRITVKKAMASEINDQLLEGATIDKLLKVINNFVYADRPLVVDKAPDLEAFSLEPVSDLPRT